MSCDGRIRVQVGYEGGRIGMKKAIRELWLDLIQLTAIAAAAAMVVWSLTH